MAIFYISTSFIPLIRKEQIHVRLLQAQRANVEVIRNLALLQAFQLLLATPESGSIS